MGTADRAWPPPRIEVLQAAMLLLALALAYYVGVHIGLAFTPRDYAVSLLWPPNAILLAALLLCPPRAWVWPLLAVLPAHLISEVPSGVPLAMAVLWYLSNASEALVAAGIIYYLLGEPPRFARVRHVIVYLAAGVLCAPVLSSFLDAAFVALIGWRYDGDYWAVVRSRLPSNALAALIVPTFALMARDSVRLLRGVSPMRWLEAALLLSALGAVSFVVFHQPRSPDEAAVYVYAPLPLLVWAALRTGVAGVAASVAVLTFTAITGTLSRMGPFVLMPNAAISILSLQTFLIVAAATLMLMAAALAELHKARIAALRSKARLSLALNAARLGTWEWRMRRGRM